MVSRQLELGFENRPGLKPAGRSRRRSGRANWWFERMRGTVDHVRDWPAPAAQISRSTSVLANSSSPLPAAVSRTLKSNPPAEEVNPPSVPEPPRWRFGGDRRPF